MATSEIGVSWTPALHEVALVQGTVSIAEEVSERNTTDTAGTLEEREPGLCGSTGTVTMDLQGGVLICKVHQGNGGGSSKGGGRGAVGSEPSAASLRRLRHSLKRVDWEAKRGPVMVTLTYKREYPTARETKVHRERLCKRFVRRGWGGHWVLQPQRRGAPHYHLLVSTGWVSKQWLAQVWEEVTEGAGGYVDVRQVPSKQGVGYMCRYISRGGDAERDRGPAPGHDAQAEPAAVRLDTSAYLTAGESDGGEDGGTWLNPGRWWGVFGGDLVPWAERTLVKLHVGAWFWRLRRSCGRYWRGLSRWGRVGFTLYVQDACAWNRLAATYLAECAVAEGG